MMYPHLPLNGPGTAPHRFERLAAEHRLATRGTTELFSSGDSTRDRASTVVMFPGRTGVLGVRTGGSSSGTERRSA
jgi:hypothetical protein